MSGEDRKNDGAKAVFLDEAVGLSARGLLPETEQQAPAVVVVKAGYQRPISEMKLGR